MFKKVKLPVLFIVFFISASIFAAPIDLAVKFLDKADVALRESNLEDAYKYVNQALMITKDGDEKESEDIKENILNFAQNVYSQKLKLLLDDYDEMEFIDIKMNLEKYPKVSDSTIDPLIRKIESANKESLVMEDFVNFEASENMNGEVFEVAEKTDETREFLPNDDDNLYEFSKNITSSLVDIENAVTDSAEEAKYSTKVMAFAIISISGIVLIIILLIIIICKKGFNQQHVQQEQYIQAFKILASNQSQTNKIMLGGVTDIYGGNAPLKIAGSSKWSSDANIEEDFSEDDEKELKSLAIKCEEIGSKIDSITNRKNNSKNVSEIVYKLSLQLGLSQNMAMLNFCAAMIYDAGFLGIDPDLLNSGFLTEKEREGMKEHVSLANKYLKFVPEKYWNVFEDAVMKHHENMDGSGYPNGLKGDEIPQIARLIRVAESYVSISSKRSYRAPKDKETAVAKLKAQPQFYDEDVVEALEKIV